MKRTLKVSDLKKDLESIAHKTEFGHYDRYKAVIICGDPEVGKSHAVTDLYDMWEIPSRVVEDINWDFVGDLSHNLSVGEYDKPYYYLIKNLDMATEEVQLSTLTTLCSFVNGDKECLCIPCITMSKKTTSSDLVQSCLNKLNERDNVFSVDVELNQDDWVRWAVRNNVHPAVIGFIGSSGPDTLFGNELIRSLDAHPSPARWAAVAESIDTYEWDQKRRGKYGLKTRFHEEDLAGTLKYTVGESLSMEFLEYYKTIYLRYFGAFSQERRPH